MSHLAIRIRTIEILNRYEELEIRAIYASQSKYKIGERNDRIQRLRLDN